MDNAVYATLTRQSGLMREMQTVANNIANAATTGFRKEGVVFAEHVRGLGPDTPSLSMATASGRAIDLAQAPLTKTGAPFDLAIEGEGFFQIQTPTGIELTRAGGFTPTPEGTLITPDGFALLDEGGAPIVLPAGAHDIAVAADGTISSGGGPIARLGLVLPADPAELRHVAGTRFAFAGDVVPIGEGRIFQGFLEGSNVSPVHEVARMIEVQRAYELGQAFLEREDGRIRAVIQTLGG